MLTVAGCVFKEAVEKGWVGMPELYQKRLCRGGEGTRVCCRDIGEDIEPSKREQTLQEALRAAEKSDVPGILLGVLDAVQRIT